MHVKPNLNSNYLNEGFWLARMAITCICGTGPCQSSIAFAFPRKEGY